MAKVEWADAIKTVSGALVKINKKSAHAADQKMVLGTHRTAPTTSNSCSRIYLRGLSSVTRSTPLTENDTWARTRFTEVSQAIKARKRDLTKLTTDQQNFLAQKDQPNGKKTMQAYYWLICGAEWDQENPRS